MLETITSLQTIVPITLFLVGFFFWFKSFHKKETRLFKNLQRPIAIIGTESKAMNHEKDLLERVGFFKVELLSGDPRSVDLLSGKRLLVIGYTPNSESFRRAFNVAKHSNLPTIIYSEPGKITPEDIALLQSYSYQTMCNTPLRLISDVFSLMSTYPEDKSNE